ncbi:MAG: hypothetical protein ACE5FM_02565, partial [Methyloligellaceae bacterium]
MRRTLIVAPPVTTASNKAVTFAKAFGANTTAPGESGRRVSGAVFDIVKDSSVLSAPATTSFTAIVMFAA